MKHLIAVTLSFFICGFSLAEVKMIKIGIASNFSEVSSSSSNPYGNYFRDGIKLALKENSDLLRKKNLKIELVEFDYGSSQHRVVEAAKKACKSDVVAVLGYVYSSHALIAAPIHQKCKLPFLTPSASANSLSKFKDYVYQGTFNNSFQGEVLANYAFGELKAKKAITIPAINCAYCKDLSDAFAKRFLSLGGKVTKELHVLEEDTEYGNLQKEIKNLDFDVVLVPNHELSSSRVILALNKAGVKKPFLGGDGWGNVGEQFFGVLKGKQIEGYSLSHWLPSIKNPISQRFTKSYRKTFSKEPNDTAVLSYDAAHLLTKVIISAKGLDRSGMNKSLSELKKFSGATGDYIFQKNSAPKKSIVLLKNSGVKFDLLKVVKPF